MGGAHRSASEDRGREPRRGAVPAARQASRTALRVAALRALHQTAERPPVFVDPLAERILGPGAADVLAPYVADPAATARLRASLAVRSRAAEDVVAAACARGVDQYVILGAGLDTFAYRHAHAGLTVYEVDHDASQRSKLACLHDAGIEIPRSAQHVTIDFESGDLLGALAAAGFDRLRPAVFAMLGVVFYVEKAALMRTWQAIAACPSGTQLVFDYVPDYTRESEPLLSMYNTIAARLAAEGEPWITSFEPAALAQDLRDLGFADITDLDAAALHARYLSDRTDGFAPSPLARVVTATI